MCTAALIGWDPTIPPFPPHVDWIYEGALLVSQDRRCNFLLCTKTNMIFVYLQKCVCFYFLIISSVESKTVCRTGPSKFEHIWVHWFHWYILVIKLISASFAEAVLYHASLTTCQTLLLSSLPWPTWTEISTCLHPNIHFPFSLVVSCMKRLDQGHLHSKLEVPRLTSPGR